MSKGGGEVMGVTAEQFSIHMPLAWYDQPVRKYSYTVINARAGWVSMWSRRCRKRWVTAAYNAGTLPLMPLAPYHPLAWTRYAHQPHSISNNNFPKYKARESVLTSHTHTHTHKQTHTHTVTTCELVVRMKAGAWGMLFVISHVP